MAAFLDDLQANILKGHGRHFTANLFLGFDGMAPDAVASLLRALSGYVTSALQQLLTNRSSAGPKIDGGPVRCLFLSASGYRALGGLAKMPDDTALQEGMRSRGASLGDAPETEWGEGPWRPGGRAPDAMLLLADSSFDRVTGDLEEIERWINGTGARVLGVDRGRAQFRTFAPANGPEGVEHFGYVDGRSQPLFLVEDIKKEKPAGPEPKWNFAFNPAQFIVPDPNGKGRHSAGSYFVYRKLGQNVRGFKARERELAEALSLTGDDAERAGAMAVGRFEDGTPVALSATETGAKPVNDFNYAVDPDGLRCPFHAHIRKTNPRGDIVRQFSAADSAERNPIMARRGIPFGDHERLFDEAEGAEPESDVGLIFMAYMASISDQFEFTQKSWANEPKFVRGFKPGDQPAGIDPVIGQNADPATHEQTWLDGWIGGAAPSKFAFAHFVKLLGGEYFFAPSRSFLQNLGR
ncbi:Dyp-type peroxidase [Humitalea rosea]|uniref:Dyp-type peroxidase n=1 Tax=Humitalea rosea TaxID=990373 RepID=UPI001B874B31|nr:hypothetical protein [Humitalea rosea]